MTNSYDDQKNYLDYKTSSALHIKQPLMCKEQTDRNKQHGFNKISAQ